MRNSNRQFKKLSETIRDEYETSHTYNIMKRLKATVTDYLKIIYRFNRFAQKSNIITVAFDQVSGGLKAADVAK